MHLCSASNDQIPLLDLANIYTELVSLMGVYKMGMSDILATCFVVSYMVGVYMEIFMYQLLPPNMVLPERKYRKHTI